MLASNEPAFPTSDDLQTILNRPGIEDLLKFHTDSPSLAQARELVESILGPAQPEGIVLSPAVASIEFA